MKYIFLILAVIFLGCKKNNLETNQNQPEIVSNLRVPAEAHPDHIIFVWLENHGYNQIIGSSNAPYINSLRAKGTLFTNAYAITHPSYPNYIDFFAGQNNGVTANVCFSNVPFSTPNLYTILKGVNKTFAWYSEDLLSTGSRVCEIGDYTVHHNPTTIFTNVPTSANKPFSLFPTDYTKLENVVCISPNELNDMHNGKILTGDNWIKNHLSGLIEWCRTHNSVFVVYMDEDNDIEGNHIPVIAVGEHVKANYKSSAHINHYIGHILYVQCFMLRISGQPIFFLQYGTYPIVGSKSL